ncbi:MAG: hypothetical protein ACTHMM_22380 [Agriterribacter sp.]
MNRLFVILNTYRSLGVIPDPENFEAIINILQELKFKKDDNSGEEMTRKEIADWLVKFVKSKDGMEGKDFASFVNVSLKLNSSYAARLAKLRSGPDKKNRNFEDDFDDLA